MVDRRDVIAWFASSAVGGVVTAAVAPLGSEPVAYLRSVAKSMFEDYDYDVNAIKSVFGSIDQRSNFVPGQSHPRYDGFHPDDGFIADRFDDLVSDAAEHRVFYDDEKIPKNLQGVTVASGSPVSNALSRLLFEYEYIDPQKPLNGMLRAQNPVFELEYEFLLARSALDQLGINEPVGNTGQVGNWSIVSRRTGDILSAGNKDGRITSDYLLITRFPNIFHKESYDRGDGIFVLGGGHGAGTRGVDLLLRDSSILADLSRKIGKSIFWQALFEVSSIDHFHNDPKYGLRWHPNNLSKTFSFARLSYDVKRIEEIARW